MAYTLRAIFTQSMMGESALLQKIESDPINDYRLLVLDAFKVRYPLPGEVSFTAVEGGRSFAQFLIHILIQLQALAIAPTN